MTPYTPFIGPLKGALIDPLKEPKPSRTRKEAPKRKPERSSNHSGSQKN